MLVLSRSRRPADWDLHTKLTMTTTTLLLVISVVTISAFEWTNPATFGGLDLHEKLLAGMFAGVMPRSGGFSTVDVGEMNEATWLATDALMFVGGGSASTAGGIRVTTLAVLFLAVVAEARGDEDVEVYRRRIPASTIRIAVTVLLVGATVVLLGSLLLLALTGFSLNVVLFEVISAFATCGLSNGITPDLPDAAKYVLVAMMYIGRTGTMTLAGALALRERARMFRLPEERPVVG
jgi:Trk-type K+ transport system membrane component